MPDLTEQTLVAAQAKAREQHRVALAAARRNTGLLDQMRTTLLPMIEAYTNLSLETNRTIYALLEFADFGTGKPVPSPTAARREIISVIDKQILGAKQKNG